MTNGNRRRLSLVLLAVLLLVIAVIFAQMLPSVLNGCCGAASYSGIDIITPINSEVCLGGELLFPVTVVVSDDDLPNQIEIAEAWCRPGLEGGCIGVQPANLRDGAKRLPLVKPRILERVSSRTVPLWLGTGEWEFWHTAIDKSGRVEGYSVEPIRVRDCAP